MDLKNILLIVTAFLVPLLAFGLAFLCLFKSPNSKLAFLWFLKSIVVGVCGAGIYLLIISNSIVEAYFGNYILYLGHYPDSLIFAKAKTAYLLIAAIIGFGGGGTIAFPQLFGVYPFGYFITFLYPIILVYGMFYKKY